MCARICNMRHAVGRRWEDKALHVARLIDKRRRFHVGGKPDVFKAWQGLVFHNRSSISLLSGFSFVEFLAFSFSGIFGLLLFQLSRHLHPCFHSFSCKADLFSCSFSILNCHFALIYTSPKRRASCYWSIQDYNSGCCSELLAKQTKGIVFSHKPSIRPSTSTKHHTINSLK